MAWIDLSLNLEPAMMTTPVYWHPKVEFTQLGSLAKEGRNTHKIVLGTHTGTHMDAPYHFMPDGSRIDEIPPEMFVQECALLDFTNKKAGDTISQKEIAAYADRFKGLKAIALCTGWSAHWMTPAYFGAWPNLTTEAAHYLLEQGIKLIAMDMPSPDSKDVIKAGQDSPVHKILMAEGVILVEYLTNLNLIKVPRFTLHAFPLKLKGLDGSPARVMAKI